MFQVVDFADTPYQEQSKISCKTVNHIQVDEEEIDFSDRPASMNLEQDAFLLDSDTLLAWSRVLKQIAHEKDKRRHEMLLLERRKTVLEDNEKRVSQDLEQLEHRQRDLAVRESMVLTAEPFLQVARQLQDMRLDINSAIP